MMDLDVLGMYDDFIDNNLRLTQDFNGGAFAEPFSSDFFLEEESDQVHDVVRVLGQRIINRPWMDMGMSLGAYIFGSDYEQQLIRDLLGDLGQEALCAIEHNEVTGHDPTDGTYTEEEFEIVFGDDDRFELDDYGHVAFSQDYIDSIRDGRQAIDQSVFDVNAGLGTLSLGFGPAGVLALYIAAAHPPHIQAGDQLGTGPRGCGNR